MPRKVKQPEGIERNWEKRSQQLRQQASLMSQGKSRDHALDQADKLDAACRMRDWLKPMAKSVASN